MLHVSSSDDTSIALHHLGGDGPPLLLAHATGFCGSVWTPFARQLSQHFSCWALDFRGHGHSSAPRNDNYDWSGTADDVVAVVRAIREHTGVEAPLHACGHSMGGAALMLAQLQQSSTFAAIWTYEPIVIPPTIRREGPNVLSQGALRRRRNFANIDQAYENYSSKPPLNTFDAEALRCYVTDGLVETESGDMTLACTPEHEAQIYQMGGRHHAWDHLSSLELPIAICRGAVEPFSPSDFAPQIADRLGRATLIDMAPLGHFGPLEDPRRTAQHALEWFAPHDI